MSNLKIAFLAIVAPVTACVTRPHDPPPSVPQGYNFAYVAPQGAEIGLVQAFDDGAHTYLQFTEAPRELYVRTGDDPQPLALRVDKPFVTLDGVYSQLVVSRASNSTTIVKESVEFAPEMAAAANQATAPELADSTFSVRAPSVAERSLAAIGIPEAIQTMHANLRVSELNREIGQLHERLQALSELLERAHEAGAAVNAYFRSNGHAPRLVLQFGDNSAEARLDPEILMTLGAAARAANRIYLHGHTDAFVATDPGTHIAVRRAVAVRQLLLSQNVAPARVRLFYRGAGNFIANNATSAGKAINRRVEIEFRKL